MYKMIISMEITLLTENTERDFEEIINIMKRPLNDFNQNRQAKIKRLDSETIIRRDLLDEIDEESFTK